MLSTMGLSLSQLPSCGLYIPKMGLSLFKDLASKSSTPAAVV
jgi:hypothetical protein